ncbi:MAG: DNA polymerase III subunit beta [Kiritimatiellia bacterium]|nr:DNA polymerase III subunit beta [Kiritimatiellia bacterium]
MKIKIAKETLLNALQKVQSIVNPRSPLPVLANILFQAKEGELWLTATDLAMTIRARVAASVETAGSTTLPARRIFSIIRELPGEELDLRTDEKNITFLTCGNAEFQLNGISDEDFPVVPAFAEATEYRLNRIMLKTMLQRTGYAASTDEGRLILNGVLLSFHDEKLTAVATDGRRLALVEQEVEYSQGQEADFVLPTKTVNEFLHAVEGDGEVKLRISPSQISLDTGDVIILSKRLDGTYPNYRQVIPAETQNRVTIEREALMNAVRRVALLTSESSNSVRLTFAKNRLDIVASTPDVGEARETVAVKYVGKEIMISFNPEFLIDPLKNLDVNEVFFEITDDLSPNLIKSNDPFLYVIMPKRTS